MIHIPGCLGYQDVILCLVPLLAGIVSSTVTANEQKLFSSNFAVFRNNFRIFWSQSKMFSVETFSFSRMFFPQVPLNQVIQLPGDVLRKSCFCRDLVLPDEECLKQYARSYKRFLLNPLYRYFLSPRVYIS